jgi:hypothetical protein
VRPGVDDGERLLALNLGDDISKPFHPAAPVEELLRHCIDVAVELGNNGIDPRSAFLVEPLLDTYNFDGFWHHHDSLGGEAGLAIFRHAVATEIRRIEKRPLLLGANPMHDAGAELGTAPQGIGNRL